MNMDVQSLRHLQALRSFIGNLVDQAERACGCDCHKPPSLLLVGPPGAGKTYLVKQMGNVCEMPLFGVHTNQVHTASAVRKLFDQARDNYPSLVFMDDVDAIFSNHDEEPSCQAQIQAIRDELFSQLGSRKLKIDDPKSSKNPTNCVISSGGGRGATNGVDGSRASSRASSNHSRPRPSAPPDDEEDVLQDDESAYPDNNGIIVVAATSAPWLLYKDHELLSRFRGVYLVGLPDKQTRYNLLKSLFTNVHHNLTDQDIMVVAEKTEGFTPADLMVVVKTLTYRQFSFLLSMTAHGGSVGSSELGSSGSQTPLSSEMSETASESDLDGLPESEGHLKRGTVSASAIAAAMAAAAASGAVPKKDIRPSVSSHEKKTIPSVANKPPITLLTNDWDSESEEEEGEIRNPQDFLEHKQKESMKKKAKDSRLPTRVLDDSLVLNTPSTSDMKKSPRDGMCVPSPDSAICMAKGGEDFIEPKISARLEKSEGPCRTPSESSSSGVTSSGCDSSDSSAIVDDRVQDTCSPPPISSDSETDGDETVISPSVDSERTTEEKPKESSEEVKADMDSIEKEEVVKCDGAQGMVGENKEDLDNEIHNVEEEDRSVGTPVEFELHYSEPPEPMRDDNCAIDSDSDGEITETPRSRGRRVAFSGMSTMEPLSVDVGNDCGPPNVSLDDLPPNITLASSNLPDSILNDNHRQESAPNAILLSLLARPSPARSDRHDHPLSEPSDLASFLHPDPDLDENKTSTPIEPLGTLTPTPDLTPTPTPTPSEGSSHNGTVGSSGSGTHASVGSTSSEVHKKEDSDSSFDHSDGHTVPSDISTATCNETGETMECRTDSDERLQELDDHNDHPDSARGNEAKAMARGGLNSLLNIEGLENLTIQIITLAEVLEVVSSGYRSVSDEEIKRYTDFMVWFSNVAKSACPHSKEGSKKANAPPLDDISIDSTVYDTPSLIKKRKGPLRKLGRFLLKALMFILD